MDIDDAKHVGSIVKQIEQLEKNIFACEDIKLGKIIGIAWEPKEGIHLNSKICYISESISINIITQSIDNIIAIYNNEIHKLNQELLKY